MTLTDFLTARIAEDEAMALNAEVSVSWHQRWAQDAYGGPATKVTPAPEWQPFQPARVLADIKAKLRILTLHTPITNMQGEQECSLCNLVIDLCCGDYANETWPCRTLCLLALPYSTHRGYDPQWRP